MEKNDGHNQPEVPPYPLQDKPSLELAWRGLVICISEGQMTRKAAREMLESWDAAESHLHDIGPEGDAGA